MKIKTYVFGLLIIFLGTMVIFLLDEKGDLSQADIDGIFVQFLPYDIQLNDGDLIVLYTDGIIEAKNEVKEEFGLERLEWFVKMNKSKSPKDFLVDFRNSFKEFAKYIQDDITMVVIKVS